MRKTIEISNAERQLIKKAFSLYGSIKPLTVEKGVSRDALKRLIDTGRATSEIVEKVREYLNTES
ncbi:MAG: hypothetical protein H7Y03_09085 [Chitinophagaceae bacterium]|nr:hypothetical protein [Chitinophagaceae bacterium]